MNGDANKETTMNKNMKRVYARISTMYPCTTIGILAGDLGLSARTVQNHVNALVAAGMVEAAALTKAEAAEGYQAPYQLTRDAKLGYLAA